MSARQTCREEDAAGVPCHVGDPDLWFAENPVDLERAKVLCADCPIRRECLTAALEREEPWGVWGGEILERGSDRGAQASAWPAAQGHAESRQPRRRAAGSRRRR